MNLFAKILVTQREREREGDGGSLEAMSSAHESEREGQLKTLLVCIGFD